MILSLNKVLKKNQEIIKCSPTAKLIFFFFYVGHIYNIKDFFYHRFLSYTGDFSSRVCPPYFQSCNAFAFQDLPNSMHYSLFSWLIVGLFTTSFYYFIKNNFYKASVFILPVLIIETIQSIFLVSFISMPFEYFSTCLFIIFLLSRHKIENLKFMVLLFYILAGLTKITPAWILAEYINNLSSGFPLIPQPFNLIMANIVIIFELVLINYLFTNRKNTLSNIVFLFFILFHLYSYLIVGIRYPLYCLPLIIILYFSRTNQPLKLSIKILGLVFIILNTFHLTLAGDHRITYEASKLILNMFDGNRQSITKIQEDGKDDIVLHNNKAYNRFSAYHAFNVAKSYCHSGNKVGLEFTISIDREPFYRIIDEENICLKDFHPFQRNSWIKTDHLQIIGYPTENKYIGKSLNKEIISSKRLNFSKPYFYKFFKENYQNIKSIYYFFFLLSILNMLILRDQTFKIFSFRHTPK